MNPIKAKRQKIKCLHHRALQYEKALDNLIINRTSPNYVYIRWQKLKQVKEG